MSIINRLVVTTDTNGVSPTGFSNADAPTIMRQCADLLGRGAQGGCAANLKLAFAPIAAKATVTAGSTGTNGDTLTIANVVITMKTSGADSSNNEINIGGSVTALMDQVTALVNGTASGSPNSWAGICSASNLAGVLTLTAFMPGTAGNGLQLSISSTALTITHAWGTSVAGTEGTYQAFSLGL